MKRNFALAALLVLALIIMQVPTAVNADSEPCDCLEKVITLGIGNPSDHHKDNSPAVWVGGNFTAMPGFRESEGLLVVCKEMTVKTNGWLGVGTAGAGSGKIPDANSVMLAVGGDLEAISPSRVRISPPVTSITTVTNGIIPAVALIGGEVRGDVLAQHEDGVETIENIYDDLGPSAISHWADFKNQLITESKNLADMDYNGDVDPAEHTWDPIVFTGTDSGTDLQVFEIDDASIFATTEFGNYHFNSIPVLPDGRFVPILINVYGEDIHFFQNTVHINGEQVNSPAAPKVGNAASAILWNFVEAKTLDITGDSQVMGSIIAPDTVSVNITTSTNGRLYVNGNLTRSSSSFGNTEHHNFPWTGGEWYFKCSHEPLMGVPDDDSMSLTISKTWEPRDSEQNISGWKAVFQIEGPGDFDEEVVITGNGFATITGLAPGEYSVTETPIEGFSTTVSVNGVAAEGAYTVTVNLSADNAAVAFVNSENEPPENPGGETGGDDGNEPDEFEEYSETGSGVYYDDSDYLEAEQPAGRGTTDELDDPDNLENLTMGYPPTWGRLDDDSIEPGVPGDFDGYFSLPKTGVNSNTLELVIAMCCSAMLGITSLMLLRKSNKERFKPLGGASCLAHPNQNSRTLFLKELYNNPNLKHQVCHGCVRRHGYVRRQGCVRRQRGGDTSRPSLPQPLKKRGAREAAMLGHAVGVEFAGLP